MVVLDFGLRKKSQPNNCLPPPMAPVVKTPSTWSDCGSPVAEGDWWCTCPCLHLLEPIGTSALLQKDVELWVCALGVPGLDVWLDNGLATCAKMRVCVDVDITSKAQTPMIESEREGERDKETAQNSRGRGGERKRHCGKDGTNV